jgi:hypothetical protein
MICCSWQAWKEKRQYKKWLKQLQILKHLQTIEQLFQDNSGHVISCQARLHQPNLALTYGEIDLESFLALMSMTHPSPEDIFYDLGCGLGKTVFACHQVFNLKKCYGIEYLPELIEIAHKKQQALSLPLSQMEFICQDILDINWPSDSILYLNVASFVPDFWQNINQKILQNPAKKIITLAKPILNLKHHQIKETKVLTSWGVVPAYVHRKF